KCGEQLKKVSLEMGGKNAVIVMDDADLKLAVEGIVWSAFGTSGQRCTACSRVIVHEDVQEDVEQMLVKEMEKLTIGNGLDEVKDGYYFAPTLFTDVTPDMRIAQEEIFGPVVSLIPVKSFAEAIEVNNDVAYGLSSSIFTNDVNKVFKAQRDLDTGIVYVNAGTTGAEIHLPFGGTKGTGNGHRDSGVQALDVFTEWKAVYVDFSGKLQRAQIDVE